VVPTQGGHKGRNLEKKKGSGENMSEIKNSEEMGGGVYASEKSSDKVKSERR